MPPAVCWIPNICRPWSAPPPPPSRVQVGPPQGGLAGQVQGTGTVQPVPRCCARMGQPRRRKLPLTGPAPLSSWGGQVLVVLKTFHGSPPPRRCATTSPWSSGTTPVNTI